MMRAGEQKSTQDMRTPCWRCAERCTRYSATWGQQIRIWIPLRECFFPCWRNFSPGPSHFLPPVTSRMSKLAGITSGSWLVSFHHAATLSNPPSAFSIVRPSNWCYTMCGRSSGFPYNTGVILLRVSLRNCLQNQPLVSRLKVTKLHWRTSKGIEDG